MPARLIAGMLFAPIFIFLEHNGFYYLKFVRFCNFKRS